jgi:hypothetical protein
MVCDDKIAPLAFGFVDNLFGYIYGEKHAVYFIIETSYNESRIVVVSLQ